MSEITITCSRGRYEATVKEPGSNGASCIGGEYDTPLGAVVSLAAAVFDNWLEAMRKREKDKRP